MMGRLGIGTISWCGRERFGNQSFRFISFHPSTWRDALLSSRICRFWRAMLPHCRKTGGHGFCRAEKIFGRVGAKSEGTPPGVPKSFSVVQEHDPPAALLRCRIHSKFWSCRIKLEGCSPEQPNSFKKSSVVQEHDPPVKPKNGSDWRMASGEWRTKNPQPHFTLHASRFTLNPQLATRNPISGLTPLLPVIFTLYALRFTLPTNFGANAPPTCHFYALCITLYASNSHL